MLFRSTYNATIDGLYKARYVSLCGSGPYSNIIRVGTVIPPCVTLTYPANGAINIPNTAQLTWQTGDSNTTGYYVKLGTDSANLQVVAGTTGTSYRTNLSYNTKYYWQVVPYGSGGSPTGCVIRNFKTFEIGRAHV